MDVQEREVRWYRRHGRHAERIRLDGAGREYVVGDWSWRRRRGVGAEHVESRMREAGVYRPLQPKRCGVCGVVKPPQDFYVTARGYLTWPCKPCSKARAAKWQREHPKGLRLVS